MSSSNSLLLLPKTTILVIPLLFLTSLTVTIGQQTMPAIPSGPTLSQCGPGLLAMAPCSPYVQGRAPSPSLQCCDSLKQVYNEQHDCLCLFLNGTALATLPINATLALKLPSLCSPQMDVSTCSPSSSSGKGGPARSPGSQASFKSPGSSTAVGPAADTAPMPSTVEFGIRKNSAYKITSSQLGVAVAVIPLLLAALPL